MNDNNKGDLALTAINRPPPSKQGDAEALPQPKPSNDRFLAVFFIFILQGCAALAPWNMFITICYPYFVNYKLSSNYVNQTGEFSGERAEEVLTWQNDFCHRMTIANQIPNLIFTIVNCFIQLGEHTHGIRIVASLCVVISTFVVATIMAAVDTSGNMYVFIGVTLAFVVLMMAGVAVFQNSVFAIAAPLPMRYFNAIILGNNLTGVLVTLFSIITLVASPDMKIAAIVYFIMGIVVLAAAFGSYLVLRGLNFYRYYIALRDQKQEEKGPKPTFVESLRTFWSIFSKLWVHYLDIFLSYFVTLFAFPNVVMWIAASNGENFFITSSEMYSQVLCFLTFNVFAFLGNFLPNWVQFPGPRFLWIFTTARFLFIPLFLFFNFTPPALQNAASGFRRRFPVLIGNSWVFWVVMVLFSVTHGHVSSLAMMYAPNLADPAHVGKAGMLAGLFLVVGINAGIIVSGSGIVEAIMLTTTVPPP